MQVLVDKNYWTVKLSSADVERLLCALDTAADSQQSLLKKNVGKLSRKESETAVGLTWWCGELRRRINDVKLRRDKI